MNIFVEKFMLKKVFEMNDLGQDKKIFGMEIQMDYLLEAMVFLVEVC